ncbi:hypothetical protein AaE_002169, partial [Aphanomyces astaci]
MLHRSSMLFKMYTTVGFVCVETNRLRYISQNGDKLRFVLYASVKEAARNTSLARLSHPCVLKSSKEWLAECVQYMLLIMEDKDKFRTVEDINSVVSACIPDKIKNPQLHESVKNFMTHMCTHVQYDDNGQPIPSARACTDKTGKCKNGFPHPLQATTTEGVDGYAKYRRDPAGDQYCVPYTPYLVHKYNCHINVEVCTSTKAVKYLYKCVYK